MESNSKPLHFDRPGDPKAPCLAVLSWGLSGLKLVNLKSGSNDAVRISNRRSRGIVTIGNEVFAVTEREILKVHKDGKTTTMKKIDDDLDEYSQVVSFQKKIYIIQPAAMFTKGKTFCFDPANNSFIKKLPGCGLSFGFCAAASGNFIYAMGGWLCLKTMKYDPVQRRWTEVAPLSTYVSSAMAATQKEKIYLIGCLPGNRVVQLYDPDGDSWTEISRMYVGRVIYAAVVVNGRLYAVGGDGAKKENGLYQNTIEVIYEDQWQMVTEFESTRRCQYATVWPHGSSSSVSATRMIFEGNSTVFINQDVNVHVEDVIGRAEESAPKDSATGLVVAEKSTTNIKEDVNVHVGDVIGRAEESAPKDSATGMVVAEKSTTNINEDVNVDAGDVIGHAEESTPKDSATDMVVAEKSTVSINEDVNVHARNVIGRAEESTSRDSATDMVVAEMSTVSINEDVNVHARDVIGRAEESAPKAPDDDQQSTAPSIHGTDFSTHGSGQSASSMGWIGRWVILPISMALLLGIYYIKKK